MSAKEQINSGLHPLYLAAVRADDAFQAALVATYGPKRAADARYYRRHQYAVVTAAGEAKRAADEAWVARIRDFRLAQNQAIREGVGR